MHDTGPGRRNHGLAQDEWVFVDLGFSQGTQSTGLAHDRVGETSKPQEMYYGTACGVIEDLAAESGPPLHLVLEAPLSTSFDRHGNPQGRKGENVAQTIAAGITLWVAGSW